MKKNNSRLLLLLLYVFSVLVIPLGSQFTVSASIYSDADPIDQVKAHYYYNSVATCIRGGHLKTSISAAAGESVTPSAWMKNTGVLGADPGKISVGYVIDSDDGDRTCANLITTALNTFGWKNETAYEAALGEFGYTLNGNNFTRSSAGMASAVLGAIRTKLNGGEAPELDTYALYNRNMVTFLNQNACGAERVNLVKELVTEADRSKVNTEGFVVVRELQANGTAEDVLYSSKGFSTATGEGYTGIVSKYTLGETRGGGAEWATCQQIASAISRWAVQLASEISAKADADGTTLREAAASSGIDLDAITIGASGSGDGEASTCNIGGLGWVICPLVRFLAGITDSAYGYVTAMLTVPSRVIFNTDAEAAGSLYAPWSMMRNVANVAFVIAFLVIIYSQITSMGVSNYGIKKMLPRLIVAALLVNSSFWIAGIAVDASNVVGESIYRVFDGVDLYNDSGTVKDGPDSWTRIGDAALLGAGAAATGGAVVGGLLSISVFLPMILTAVLAILLTVFVLTVRQAFVIGLIVIAPLAFVAYLLPNTEDWFKRWWSVFKTLLLLFPVIAFIFSASQLASQVLTEVAEAYDNHLKFVMQVMAAGVQILPLFLTTILTNITGGVLGKVTGFVNNKERGLIDRSKKLRSDRQKHRWEATKAGYGRFGRRSNSKNPLDWGSKAAGAGGRLFDRYGRSRKTDLDRYDKELESDWLKSKGGGKATIDAAVSDVGLQAIKSERDAEVEEIKAGNAAAGYSSGDAKKVQEAVDNTVYQQMRKDSASREASRVRTDKIVDSEAIQNLAGGIDRRGASRVRSLAEAAQDKANDEAVSNSIATLSNYPGHEQMSTAEKQLEDAVGSGDAISARAATRFLATSFGSKGQEVLHEKLKTMQSKGLLSDGDVLDSIKAEGRATGAKNYDSVMDSFYIGGPEAIIADLELNKDNITRLNETQLAGQTTKQLDTWRMNNAMSREKADSLLKAHSENKLPLDDKRRVVLEAVSRGDRTTKMKDLLKSLP